ncbi:MAG: methylamine utilization protein MauJ [Bacteroidota bacterium]
MLPKWIVTIYASGPIVAENRFNFTKRKDINTAHALYSNIKVMNAHGGGLIIELNVYAKNHNLAEKAAFTFLGYAFDVLSFKLNLPIELSVFDRRQSQRDQFPIRREITIKEFSDSFDESRLLRLTEPFFLNAHSWFRKGLISENPIDKYLAFWNSIEILAANYHIKSEKTKKGIKNQVWSIFHELFGETENWKTVILDYDNWINKTYFLRKEIAHGSGDIGETEFIESILDSTEELQIISMALLRKWRKDKLITNSKITDNIEKKLDPVNWFHFGQTNLN